MESYSTNQYLPVFAFTENLNLDDFFNSSYGTW